MSDSLSVRDTAKLVSIVFVVCLIAAAALAMLNQSIGIDRIQNNRFTSTDGVVLRNEIYALHGELSSRMLELARRVELLEAQTQKRKASEQR